MKLLMCAVGLIFMPVSTMFIMLGFLIFPISAYAYIDEEVVSGNVLTESNNVIMESNIITETTSQTVDVVVQDEEAPTLDLNIIKDEYSIASSDVLVISHYKGDYYLFWSSSVKPVRLVRGDFNTNFMLFTETEIYSGSETNYFVDTVADNNTKYFTLYHRYGRQKIDINKEGFYDLVINNAIDIQDDQQTMQREVRIAQFGRAMIMMWKSMYEGYAIDLNYSGTSYTDINDRNGDNNMQANYYIIDNVNNLTSITTNEITAYDEKVYLYKINFSAESNHDPEGEELVTTLTAGTTSTVYINNGELADQINHSDSRNGIFSDGSGGGGGGCFLTR